MFVARQSSSTGSSLQFAWLGKHTMIAVLLALFFALHVLAGALLQDRVQAGAAPTHEEESTSLHD